MAILLFSNNASTTLAGAIASGATSANLAAGTGALFPNPAAGQYFIMTFIDQATGLNREIVYVTARSGDTITITRGQEGTTAQAWSAGDTAENRWTAGSAAAMVQVSQLQQQAGNYASDTGSANAYAVTLTPAPSLLSFLIGVPIRVKISHTNTGSSTLNVNGLGATLIVNTDGNNLYANQLFTNAIATFMYDGVHFQLVAPASYELLGQPNTWAGIQQFNGGALLANNFALQGNDAGGTPRNILGLLSDNYVHAYAGASGFLLHNYGATINSLSIDNSGNATVYAGLTTGAGITANQGSISASNGRLRAALGAAGSGDASAAATLRDWTFTSSTTNSVYSTRPDGVIDQTIVAAVSCTNGVLATAVNLVNPFPTAMSEAIGTFSGVAPPLGISVSAYPISRSQVGIYTNSTFNLSGISVVVRMRGY